MGTGSSRVEWTAIKSAASAGCSGEPGLARRLISSPGPEHSHAMMIWELRIRALFLAEEPGGGRRSHLIVIPTSFHRLRILRLLEAPLHADGKGQRAQAPAKGLGRVLMAVTLRADDCCADCCLIKQSIGSGQSVSIVFGANRAVASLSPDRYRSPPKRSRDGLNARVGANRYR